jgi:hypothetical protein
MNPQVGKRYFIANPTDQSTGLGLQACLDDGWKRVNHKRSPERLRGGAIQDSGDVTWKGQVLLWMTDEEYAAYRADIEAARRDMVQRLGTPVVDETGKPATDMDGVQQ